jgi:Rap1a immunity proteins
MRSIKLLFFVALFVFCRSTYGAAQPEPVSKEYMVSGAYLFHQCEAVALEHPTANESIRSLLCLAYIEGYTSADHTECAFVPYSEMARVYVAYMKKHPDVMKMNKDVGLLLALVETYPCHHGK